MRLVKRSFGAAGAAHKEGRPWMERPKIALSNQNRGRSYGEVVQVPQQQHVLPK